MNSYLYSTVVKLEVSSRPFASVIYTEHWWIAVTRMTRSFWNENEYQIFVFEILKVYKQREKRIIYSDCVSQLKSFSPLSLLTGPETALCSLRFNLLLLALCFDLLTHRGGRLTSKPLAVIKRKEKNRMRKRERMALHNNVSQTKRVHQVFLSALSGIPGS